MTPSEQIESLQEENRQLRALLGASMPWPVEWRLSRSQAIILGLFVNRPLVTMDMLMTALYGDRPEPPNENTVRVHLSKLRQKMSDLQTKFREISAFCVSCTYRVGWSMPDEIRAEFRAISEYARINDAVGRTASR